MRSGPSILVPFDGSPAARSALAHAVRLASGTNGRVTLLGIVPDQPLGLAGAFFAPPVLCADELESELLRIMGAAADAVSARVPVSTAIRRGRWTDAVVGRVEAARHDLVVVGEPRGRLQRLVQPSLARLANRCAVPVIVRRPAPRRGPRLRRAPASYRAAGGRAAGA